MGKAQGLCGYNDRTVIVHGRKEAPRGPETSYVPAQRFRVWSVICSFVSQATFMNSSRSLRPNEVPLLQATSTRRVKTSAGLPC